MDSDNPRKPANPTYNPYAQPAPDGLYKAPFNPYAQPASSIAPSGTAANTRGGSSGGAVASSTIEELEGTKPWVRFLGILTFLGSIFLLIGAVGLALSSGAGRGAAGAPVALGLAFAYVLLALLMFYPARRMISFAAKIGNLMQSKSVADLDGALGEQRMLWRFYGLLAVVYLVVLVVGVFAMVLLPVLSGSR